MQDNKTYSSLVEQGQYPANPLVPLDAPFSDERGIIQNLLNAPINGAAIITSKKGAERSNHLHRSDFHYLYVISGSMEYYERSLEEEFQGEPLIVKAGQMVFTPPMKVHKTIFVEDTVLISLSKNNRDHNSHEADVIRVKF